MDDMQPDNTMPMGQEDHEGAMAKADLYKLANYSFKLFKKIEPDAQLEGWVQAKITKAADYIASVYHYMEYEMKFNQYGQALDNSDVLSESEKAELKNKLMEAKSAMATLKKQQAERLKEAELTKVGDSKKTRTGTLTKTATGVKHERTDYSDEEHGEPASKVKEKSAAEKKADKEKEIKLPKPAKGTRIVGMKNGEKYEKTAEGFEAGAKTGSTFKTKTGVATKTDTGVKHTNTSFNDEEHGEPTSKVKEKSASEKKADKEKEIKLPKHKGNTWGMKGGEKFGKKMEESKKEKEPEGLYSSKRQETDSQRIARLAKEKRQAEKKKAAEKVDEGSKPDFLDMDKDGNKKEPMKKAVSDKKKGAKDMWKKVKESVKVEEAKKKAKPDFADLDKDGDKTEPMKKAAKEKEVVKESADLNRMKEFLTRLNG